VRQATAAVQLSVLEGTPLRTRIRAWQRHMVPNELYVSATFWRDLGYAPGFETSITRESARRLVHPADVRLATEEVGLHLLRR
jgi:hypothetical protein